MRITRKQIRSIIKESLNEGNMKERFGEIQAAVEDILEIESPDEVQAEEDALVAAENIDPKYWLSNLSHSFDDTYDEINFELIDTVERNDEYTD